MKLPLDFTCHMFYVLFQYFSVTENILHSGKRNRAFFDDFRLTKKKLRGVVANYRIRKLLSLCKSGKNGRVVTYTALHSLS